MKIIVVEDSALVREHLIATLKEVQGAVVCGDAISEAQALKVIALHKPGIVTLDINLAPGSGLNVLKEIRRLGCRAKVFLLTNQMTDYYRMQGIACGADGYFDKSLELGQMVSEVTQLCAT